MKLSNIKPGQHYLTSRGVGKCLSKRRATAYFSFCGLGCADVPPSEVRGRVNPTAVGRLWKKQWAAQRPLGRNDL